jgi:ribosomal-protein-alanine N-acetyltransferase
MSNGQLEEFSILIERMKLDDLSQVRRIEKASFPVPWPRDSYRREILDNRRACYLAARWLDAEPLPEPPPRPFPFNLLPTSDKPANDLVAFAGLWFMIDEAHITTIAVDPLCRGRGIGEVLFIELVKLSQLRGAERMTLEVRVSNRVAQNLYRKYGFTDHGVRPRYYSDDFEDALIMWSEPLDGADFCQRLADNERDLARRLCWTTHI